MRRLSTFFAVGFLFSCSATRHAPSPTAFAPAVEAVVTDLYLPPGETGGGMLCFNPESQRLRALLAASPPKAEAPVDGRALAKDLPFLEDVMRLQYSGYAELAQRADFGLARFFADWRGSLERAGPTVSFERGVLDPIRKLRAVLPDNHHQVAGWGRRLRAEPQAMTREYQAPIGAERIASLDACRAEGPGTPFLSTLRIAPALGIPNAGSILTVSVRGGGGRLFVHCRGRTFELFPRAALARQKPPSDTDVLYGFRALGDTGLITIHQLHGTGAQLKQLEQLAGDYSQHRRSQRIVFDFRQNGGGNDEYVYAWIAKAKRGAWSSGADWELRGALTPCQLWNPLVERQILDGTVDTAEARSEREAMRAKWPPGPHRAEWVFRSGVIEDRAEQPYTGRVYVLVDRYSASSGESGPWALKSALGAVLVGERTAGLLEFGNVQSYVLPNSGVRWGLATKRNLFEQPMESVGLPVDVYLDDPAASVAEVLAKLDEAGRKSDP